MAARRLADLEAWWLGSLEVWGLGSWRVAGLEVSKLWVSTDFGGAVGAESQ
jgi:hypothetical protein